MSLSSIIQSARQGFETHFNVSPEIIVRAPGRVNLIGEHVDYNNGPVLPLAIELQVVIAARPTATRVARIQSEGWPTTLEIPLESEPRRGEPAWGNYVRGVIAGFQRRGIEIPGFEAFITSDLPYGSGLSSSAALEVATATLLEALSNHVLDLRDKALLCQKAEHEYAGVPCGIMDQFASTFGRADHVILIDCKTLEVSPIPLPPTDMEFLIIDTRVKHSLADSVYAKRRRSCEGAAQILGVESLREFPVASLADAAAKLDHESFIRSRHIVTEIARTFASVDLIKLGAWAELGALMYASHESLRDDFEVSCAELDAVVRIARGIGESGGIYGCRMTGGGFGGSAIAIVKRDAIAEIKQRINTAYQLPKALAFIATKAAEGASRIV